MVFTDSDLRIDEQAVDLLFIDDSVNQYQDLISTVTPKMEVVLLNSWDNGIQQISQTLAEYDRVSSLHIVSHGKAGGIDLGGSELNTYNIDAYADEIKNWGANLSDRADILIYGCNVAGNEDGQYLIDSLSAMTGADVAASNDLTGNQSLGGNWNWEYTTGDIESALPFDRQGLADYDYVLNMQDMQDMPNHNMNHHSSLNLLPHSQATHVAINNGGWFNPNTWQNGSVPGDEADVLIPQGRRVFYSRESDARLDTLRVDGMLKFAHARDTRMLVDTLMVAPQGKLFIGTELKPVNQNKTAQIIFTSDSAIDTEWDSKQISRGLISHGDVQINGADKLDFTSLRGDALAGDNQLVLRLPSGMKQPQGWRVGDRLVLGGTDYNRRGNDEDNSRFEDEVLTITAINGNKISFVNENIETGDNTVLRFDHKRPENYQDELKLYVANTTRNVSFSTENGATVPTQQRGHVMFMHNPNVKVNNAGFYDLGRTDKNKLIDDPVQNVDGSVGKGTNPRGRYALHFHRTGADNPNGMAAIANGNAVVSSPGWGIAHHDSNAVLKNNVVFDVVGAGIAAEAGNEIGAWQNNITIKTTGDDEKNSSLQPKSARVNRFDFGFNGDGYWVQGAGQIDILNNVAISAADAGIIHYGGGDGGQLVRDAQTFAVANLAPKYSSIAKGTDNESVIDVSAVPIRKLSGFENYNSAKGISFWATLKNVDNELEIEGSLAETEKNFDSQPAHNLYSQADNFKIWNSRHAGFHSVYSSQIKASNGLIVGDRSNLQEAGIAGNADSMNHSFENIIVDGFKYGLKIPLDKNKSWNNSQIKNVDFSNNMQNFYTRKTIVGVPTGYPSFFEIVDSTFDNAAYNNALPTAKFSHRAIGGLALNLDATASFDRDSQEKSLNGKGIVSYGWDLDNDGSIDRFGRKIKHHFDNAGFKNISLTVWDNQGATKTLTKLVNVAPTAYGNLLVDGNFNNNFSSANISKKYSSGSADLGWHSNVNWSWNSRIGNGGAAEFSRSAYSQKGLGQTIQDDSIRRGNQTLSFKLKNKEGERTPNKLTVTVWGVDGEFRNPGWNIEGLQQVGAIPMNRTKILQETVGGSDFDWKNFSWDLNFGDGYQFVVFQINAEGVNPNKGDFLAIDSIKIN